MFYMLMLWYTDEEGFTDCFHEVYVGESFAHAAFEAAKSNGCYETVELYRAVPDENGCITESGSPLLIYIP